MSDDDDRGGKRPGLVVETIVVEKPLFTKAELDELESAADAEIAAAIRLRSVARRMKRQIAAATLQWGGGAAPLEAPTSETPPKLHIVDASEKPLNKKK